MPRRTTLFNMLNWTGGVNTSQDESMIPANELTVGDNILFATRGSRRMRDGIDLGWDDVTATANGTKSITGTHDFWFGATSRTQKKLSANLNKEIRSYNSSGAATLLTDAGKAWTGTVDIVDFLTFNNQAIIAPVGSTNLIKIWDGSAASYNDLKNSYNNKLVASGRSSSGTTRTLIFTAAFKGISGDVIIVSGASGGNAASYNGTWTVTSVTTTTITNDTITFTGVGSLAEAGTSDSTLTVDGVAPLGSILREHLGRIWTNDKTNKDRVHYSGSFNQYQWLGFGDSAAIDIGIGDGDPEGITAIFPTFKGDLFVAKKTKLYRITGTSPETFSVTLVSNGVGCVSHKSAAAVDQDDIYFVSDKGIHSLVSTAQFGDFSSAYLSEKIQQTFNDNFDKSRLKYVSGAYLNTANSVAFTFTDTEYVTGTNTISTKNNVLWLYNVPLKAWYRWPDISCETLIVATDTDRKRFYMGTYRGKLSKSFSDNPYDTTEADVNSQIMMTIATGQILVDEQLYTFKGYKRFILYYKPQGSNILTCTLKIDNFALDTTNSIAFTANPAGDLLGTTFILGSSLLGQSGVTQPFVSTIDGYGRGIKLTINQTGTNQSVEIQGFGIEYMPAGVGSETYTG